MAFLAPVFLVRWVSDARPGEVVHGQGLAVALSFAAAGAFVYWLGARSMRAGIAALGRPLQGHEVLLDISTRSPFDSFCFVHLRWWAVLFFAIAVGVVVKVG
jgi:hypothetical protein